MKKVYKNIASIALGFIGLFGTANAQITFTDDFESGLGNWTGTYATSTTDACATTSARDNIYTTAGGNLTSNSLGTSNGGTITGSLDYKIIDWNTSNVATTDDHGSTEIQFGATATGPWTTVYTINVGNHVIANTCATVNFTMNPPAGDFYMRVNTTYNSGDYYFYIDNVNLVQGPPPACPGPSALTVTALTGTSADLGWTENGSATDWIVEYGPVGFTPSATALTSNNPESVTGLTPQTDYEFYVRSYCAAGDTSAWSGPFSFSTPCASIVAPWTEGFENSGTIPDCWTMAGGENWLFNTSGPNHVGNNGNITGTTNTNNYYAVVDASGSQAPAELYSPMIDVSGLSYPRLTFFEISDNEGNANSQLDVEVWDGAAWNLVGTYNTNTIGWELKTIYLYGLTFTGDAQVRFTFSEIVSGDFYDDIAIDDVTIDEGPACPQPSNIVSNLIDNDSVVVAWTPGASETMWNIELGANGFTPGTGAELYNGNSVNPTDTIPGLVQLTDYDVYVQADCGADSSVWVGPFTFTTLPNCPDVSNIVVSYGSGDTVIVDWVSNGTESMWDLSYGLSGFTAGSGTQTSAMITSDSITGLMSALEYDIYVRSNCGGSDSGAWIGPVTFITPCFDILPATLPFVEDFENLEVNIIGDSVFYCGPEKSWNFTTDLQNFGRVRTGTNSNVALGGNGSMTLDVSVDGNDAISYATLTLDLSAYSASNILTFSCQWMEHGDETDFDDKIWVRGSSSDAWITVLDWNGTNGQLQETIEFDLSGLLNGAGQVPTSSFQVRFGWSDNFEADSPTGTDGVTFDNIVIEEVSCLRPTDLVQLNAINDSIVLGWTVNGGETEWAVEYGPVGFTPGTGTLYSTTTNPDTIGGLGIGEVYDFYVRAICGPGDSSKWVGPTVMATEIPNDASCDAILVQVDGSTDNFSTINATQQLGENFHGNGNTVWFKAVVPASGHFAIGTCGMNSPTSIEAFGWHVDCDSVVYNGITGSTSNPWGCDNFNPAGLELCGQTPGDTIYFSVASFTNDIVFPLTLWDLEYEAGTGSAVTSCAGDTVNLASEVTGSSFEYTGYFEYPDNPTVVYNDSLALTSNFSLTNSAVQFIVENSCMSDTTDVTFDIFTAPNTGTAVSPYEFCNYDLDIPLFGGLTGTYDGDGVWSDDDNSGRLSGSIVDADALTSGNYNFTYTVDNGVCPAESTTLVLTISDCVGVSENEIDVNVFPNPNNGSFTLTTSSNGNVTLVLTDAAGAIVAQKVYQSNAGVATNVDLGKPAAGIYMLNITTENGSAVKTIMIK